MEMKKITILSILCFLLVGCGSSTTENVISLANEQNNTTDSSENEMVVKEVVNQFMNALQEGDIPKAASYCDSDYGQYLTTYVEESTLQMLEEEGFSKEVLQMYQDFSESTQRQIYQALSDFEITSYYEGLNDYYVVDGEAKTINVSDIANRRFSDMVDETLANEINRIMEEEGENAAREYYLRNVISRMEENTKQVLQNGKPETCYISVEVEKIDGELKVINADGLMLVDEPYALVPAENYDAHGLYTQLEDDWYILSDEEAQGSTFAAASDFFQETMSVELHFTEDTAQASSEEAYFNYAQTTMVEEVNEVYAKGGFDSFDVESVTVEIDQKQYYGVHVDARIGENHLYELDVPVYTNDGNVTMIAILSYFNDATYDVLKLVHRR